MSNENDELKPLSLDDSDSLKPLSIYSNEDNQRSSVPLSKTATNEIAQDVCGYIRSVVAELYGQEVADQVRIQYGGSVKPEGLKALLEQPDIDGALVGGASLVEDSYKAMIAALD